ncbi:hypothetical protein CHS0354_006745 [Potamilus streckersoni]|uniref:dolichyl-phosphate-mannose--protein mannosyltransferase n=1 Tax=Potamilus streckersoni TaxID=2493646 RepID=A0AAE0VHR5_9BIVA|nr:hypothetical protein CHS0354_006745 [Potamilus streckersoni]
MDSVIPLLPSAVALILYLNTLGADFAYDDSRAIKKNQDLQPETPIVNIFYDDFWGTPLTHSGSHKSYRPLCVLTFRINYFFGELDPWGYHLGNVLCHVITTAVFTYLSRLLLKDTLGTAVSGILFAAHPVHTEAVAGIVGRADVLASFFFMLSLLSYMKYVELRDITWHSGGTNLRLLYVLCTGLFVTASLLTKEQGVTVLAVCATYDLFVRHKVRITDIAEIFKKDNSMGGVLEGLFFLFMVGVSLVTFRIYFMGNSPPEFAPSDNPASDSDSLLTRTLTYLLLPSLNFWLLLCPRILSFDWSMEAIPLVETFTDYRNLFTALFYSSLIYLAVNIVLQIHNSHSIVSAKTGIENTKKSKILEHKHFIKNKYSPELPKYIPNDLNIFIISVAIIVFPFIPATNLFFYVGFVIAERVLYIPSMGFCLLVAKGVSGIYRKLCKTDMQRRGLLMAVVILCMLLSWKTVLRNKDWQTEENLYRSGIAVNPAKAWGNLANIFNEKGMKKEAEEAYRNALSHRGNMADVHYNLGLLLQDQKRYDEAIISYKTAIQCRAKLSMGYLNLGILFAQVGRQEEARKMYLLCADLDTSGLKDPRLHESTKISCLYNLGRLYIEQNRNKEALEVYQKAVQRMPSYYQAQSLYNMIGEVYFNLGDLVLAEEWYLKALQAKPNHVPAHITLSKLFQKKGDRVTAEKWLKKGREADPSDFRADLYYAQFMAGIGKLQEAAVMFDSAVRKSPDDFDLCFAAADIFRQVGRNGDAENMYLKATQLKPENAIAYMNLGAMLHINNKFEAAERSYLTALRLKPNDETTKENLAKLRSLMRSQQKKVAP